MRLSFKPGVSINGAQPETVLGIMVVTSVMAEHGLHAVITSITDDAPGRHPRSLHPAGLAFDLRSWEFSDNPERRGAWLTRFEAALGPEWDIVDEGDHFHFEFDPGADHRLSAA